MRFGATVLVLLLAPSLSVAAAFKNISYGPDAAQQFDVYAPDHVQHAPIIVMVHGGGWRRDDKDMGRVVDAKSEHYNALGYVFVSVNYRMDNVTPVEEAADVLAAVNGVEARASEWGGDPAKVILIGHSAGAHLVSLLNAQAAHATVPWIGTVSLDSGALDVPQIMENRHFPLYDRAFGSNPADWRAASPYHQLHAKVSPMLMVCSAPRQNSCSEASSFKQKAEQYGSRVEVLSEEMSHSEINYDLGKPSDYTSKVDAFIASLL